MKRNACVGIVAGLLMLVVAIVLQSLIAQDMAGVLISKTLSVGAHHPIVSLLYKSSSRRCRLSDLRRTRQHSSSSQRSFTTGTATMGSLKGFQNLVESRRSYYQLSNDSTIPILGSKRWSNTPYSIRQVHLIASAHGS